MDSLYVLEKLIGHIIKQYDIVNKKWIQDSLYQKINLKKEIIKNIYNNKFIYETILNYRAFINKEIINLILDMQNKYNINKCSSIEIRIKTQNSIEFKLKNYFDNHENGETQVIKCFNDILGLRIIFDNSIKYEDIKMLVDNKFPKLKCILAIRGEGINKYKAVHIYIRDGKYNFPWELQVWNRKDELNNKKSHKKYKQEYAKWELENKGGAL